MVNRKFALLVIVTIAFIGCGKNTVPISGTSTSSTSETKPVPAGLAGYEPMTIPADNPMTPEKDRARPEVIL